MTMEEEAKGAVQEGEGAGGATEGLSAAGAAAPGEEARRSVLGEEEVSSTTAGAEEASPSPPAAPGGAAPEQQPPPDMSALLWSKLRELNLASNGVGELDGEGIRRWMGSLFTWFEPKKVKEGRSSPTHSSPAKAKAKQEE